MSKIHFESLLKIYRTATFEADGVVAHLQIADAEQLEILRNCFSDETSLDDSGLSLDDGDPDNFSIGQKIILKVHAPRSGLGRLAKNAKDLIEQGSNSLEEPSRYFLIEENFSKNDPAPPDEITKYRKILEFIGLISQCATYIDKIPAELVFLHKGKFVLPIKYTLAQIESVDLSKVERLLSFFVDDMHKEQKLAIMTNTIINLIETSSLNRRFENLLLEIDDLLQKFLESYKIFIADFSYDKVRNEFEEFKIEYAGKIHKVFSDIQNQLLTIPVATVVVATSMKSSTSESLHLSNLAVLLGAWVFSTLFTLLCINQSKTLSALKVEVERQRKTMEDEYPTISPKFNGIFEWLSGRIKLQFGFLIAVVAILAVGLASANYFYFKMESVGHVERTAPSKHTAHQIASHLVFL